MNPSALVLLPLLLLAAASPLVTTHYLPQANDGFRYTETISVDQGYGDYLGYTETSFVNGSITVTSVQSSGIESAAYANTVHYVNSTGADQHGSSSGTFTFSAVTFQYVQGTDNQTGYSHPFVWFYMNNSLPVGASFYLLNSHFSVQATSFPFLLNTAAGHYVATLEAQATGSYLRNDSYGSLSATYTWSSYFDPATGYVVGYDYVEHDSNASHDGFTLTDTLRVTSTTYPLTAAAAPPSGQAFPWLLVAGVTVALVVVVVIVLLVVLRARRRRLPKHPTHGTPSYSVPPPGPAPPPISLLPGDQPAVQQIVVKETVKVNCRYCGSLIDSTAATCPFCGASRT